MDKKEFNIAMAKLDGYTNIKLSVSCDGRLYGDHPEYGRTLIPDYKVDLNALMPLVWKLDVICVPTTQKNQYVAVKKVNDQKEITTCATTPIEALRQCLMKIAESENEA